MVHPDIEIGEHWGDDASFGRIVPVYPEIEGISSRAFRRLAWSVVQQCAHLVDDFLPPDLRAIYNLMSLPGALAAVHFPADDVEVRGWDGTSELRYLVLPERPAGTEGMSETQLAALVTRDAMVGVSKVTAPPQGSRA